MPRAPLVCQLTCQDSGAPGGTFSDAVAIAISADGSTLFVAEGDDDTMTTCTIDGLALSSCVNSGQLTNYDTVWDIAIGGQGDYLFAVDYDSTCLTDVRSHALTLTL